MKYKNDLKIHLYQNKCYQNKCRKITKFKFYKINNIKTIIQYSYKL